jgi:hypothetical protein
MCVSTGHKHTLHYTTRNTAYNMKGTSFLAARRQKLCEIPRARPARMDDENQAIAVTTGANAISVIETHDIEHTHTSLTQMDSKMLVLVSQLEWW